MLAYIMTVATVLMINVVLACSFNIVLGCAGLFSAAQAAFYGLGAYVAALAMLNLGVNFVPAMLLSIVVTALAGGLVGRLTIRLGGDYLVIGTLAVQFILIDLMANMDSVTGGRFGLNGIPRPTLFGYVIGSVGSYLVFATIIAFVVVGITIMLLRSPWGRLLRAMREDEIALASLSKDVTWIKVSALAIGSGLAAVAGALYASFVGFIDPTAFELPVFIGIMAMVIVGGSGTTFGPIVGSIVLTAIPEIVRFAGISGTSAGPIRQIIYAIMLLVITLYLPKGLSSLGNRMNSSKAGS